MSAFRMEIYNSANTRKWRRYTPILLVRSGRCFDGETGGEEKETHVFPCIRNNWGQLLSVGNGRTAPLDALFFHVPQQQKQFMEKNGQEYHPSMCLGVSPRRTNGALAMNNNTTIEGNNIMAIPCTTNSTEIGAPVVVEFFFVPFISEDDVQPDNFNDKTTVTPANWDDSAMVFTQIDGGGPSQCPLN